MRINPKLKLWHKGFILVALPLVFELIFLTSMAYFLARAEEQASQLAQSRETIAQINQVEQLMYHTIDDLTGYETSLDPAWRERYERDTAELHDLVIKIRELVQKYPKERLCAERLERAQILHEQSLKAIKEALDRRNRIEAIMLASSRARRVGIDTIAEETQELVRLEKEHTIDPGEESQTRGQMQKLLWIGLILNISVAIGLAAYFNRGTVQRLQVLMENSQRLTRKEPLNPPLAGGDEIADLDRVFHEMAASLAEADRMKQEFVAMVSHDLRAPLSSVRGALDLVARGTYGALSEKGKQILATADGSVRRLIKLVNDILDVEKLETGKLDFLPEAVSVARIIQRSLDSVRTLAEQSQCPLSADDPEFNIYADEDRLVQVLVNLLSNAIKFSPKGESVQITTCSDDGWIEVRVADRGCGIPLEHQQAIFERFRQIKVSDSKEKGGTGLGLAICKAIIEQHGGSIGVDSEVGKGSTFWFRLPAGVPPAIASLGASGSPE